MSYSVSTGRVETSPVQNDSGSISVAILDHSTASADENPFRQQQAGLGSRTATAARHRRVGGRHQHHLPARPLGILDQRRFRCADGPVGRLTGHPGFRQKPRLEVLDRQHSMVGNDFGGPLMRRVLPPPCNLLINLGDNAFCVQVTFGRPLATGRLTPRHRALPASKLLGGAPPMLRVSQVVRGIGGRRHRAHTPVDTDHLIARRQLPAVAPHHKAGVPVPDAVAEYPDTARRGWHFSRPYDRNAQATGQTQAAILQRKAPSGVVQTRRAALSGLEFTTPFVLGAFGPKLRNICC